MPQSQRDFWANFTYCSVVSRDLSCVRASSRNSLIASRCTNGANSMERSLLDLHCCDLVVGLPWCRPGLNLAQGGTVWAIGFVELF